jgi:TRAP-type C4-dicarboxylate transport system permease small subunit
MSARAASGPNGGGPEAAVANRGPLMRLARWLDENVEYWLSFFFYSFLTLIIVIEVFRRYALNSSTSYGEEYARYAFVWLAYIATARGVRNRSHLSIDMLRERFGRTGRFTLYLFSDFCFLALALVILYTSTQFVVGGIRFDQRFTGSDLPLWLATSAVPVAWLLVCVRVVQRSVALVRAYRSGSPLVVSSAKID